MDGARGFRRHVPRHLGHLPGRHDPRGGRAGARVQGHLAGNAPPARHHLRVARRVSRIPGLERSRQRQHRSEPRGQRPARRRAPHRQLSGRAGSSCARPPSAPRSGSRDAGMAGDGQGTGQADGHPAPAGGGTQANPRPGAPERWPGGRAARDRRLTAERTRRSPAAHPHQPIGDQLDQTRLLEVRNG